MERIIITGVGQFDRHVTDLPADCSQHVRLETVSLFAPPRLSLQTTAWSLALFLTGMLSGLSLTLVG